jgi:hypothetical protein
MTSVNESLVEIFVADSKLPDRKEYVRPAIIHELDLETRAGSPLGVKPGIDPADPLGLSK